MISESKKLEKTEVGRIHNFHDPCAPSAEGAHTSEGYGTDDFELIPQQPSIVEYQAGERKRLSRPADS